MRMQKQLRNDLNFAHLWDTIFTLFFFLFSSVFFCFFLFCWILAPHPNCISIEWRLCVAAETPQLYSCLVQYFSRPNPFMSFVMGNPSHSFATHARRCLFFVISPVIDGFPTMGCINTRCSPIIKTPIHWCATLKCMPCVTRSIDLLDASCPACKHSGSHGGWTHSHQRWTSGPQRVGQMGPTRVANGTHWRRCCKTGGLQVSLNFLSYVDRRKKEYRLHTNRSQFFG